MSIIPLFMFFSNYFFSLRFLSFLFFSSLPFQPYLFSSLGASSYLHHHSEAPAPAGELRSRRALRPPPRRAGHLYCVAPSTVLTASSPPPPLLLRRLCGHLRCSTLLVGSSSPHPECVLSVVAPRQPSASTSPRPSCHLHPAVDSHQHRRAATPPPLHACATLQRRHCPAPPAASGRG